MTSDAVQIESNHSRNIRALLPPLICPREPRVRKRSGNHAEMDGEHKRVGDDTHLGVNIIRGVSRAKLSGRGETVNVE